MRFSLTLTLAISLLSLTSCIDFFEQDVQVDIPDHDSKVVINSVMSPSDDITRIRITQSLSILDNGATEPLRNANILLTKNGTPLEVDFDSQNGFYWSSAPNPRDEYSIEAQIPGFETVSSQVTIPKSIRIIEARQAGRRFDIDGYEYESVKFTIEDNPNEENFYEISFIQRQKVLQYGDPDFPDGKPDTVLRSISYLESPIEWFTYTERGLAFSDDAFENNTLNAEVWIDSYDLMESMNDPNLPIQLVVRSCSESYYEYMTTYYIHVVNQFPDLFTGEPVQMYTNIANGFGLFGAYADNKMDVKPK